MSRKKTPNLLRTIDFEIFCFQSRDQFKLLLVADLEYVAYIVQKGINYQYQAFDFQSGE